MKIKKKIRLNIEFFLSVMLNGSRLSWLCTFLPPKFGCSLLVKSKLINRILLEKNLRMIAPNSNLIEKSNKNKNDNILKKSVQNIILFHN